MKIVNSFTETIRVVQHTEHQTAFYLNRTYFITLPSELFEEIQYDNKSDVSIKVIRNENIFSIGVFDYSKGVYILPKIIATYCENQCNAKSRLTSFLDCYMFQVGDIIELTNLEKEIGDRTLAHNTVIMDGVGWSENLDNNFRPDDE